MVHHRFKAGETIVAVIKLHNRYDVTIDELNELLIQFKELNPPKLFRPGDSYTIPVLERHQTNRKEIR